MGVGVVDHMELPHPLYLVFDEMDAIGAHEVQQEQPGNRLQPFRHGDPLQQPEMMGDTPVTAEYDQDSEAEIDNDGSDSEKDIDAGVLPFVIIKLEKWYGAFE